MQKSKRASSGAVGFGSEVKKQKREKAAVQLVLVVSWCSPELGGYQYE